MGVHRGLDLYDRISAELHSDERIVTPQLYSDNPRLYDKICGVVYLIRDLNLPENGISMIWENALLNRPADPSILVISKQLIVRLRLPWEEVEHEWLCTKSEYAERQDDLDVLEIQALVRDLEDPSEELIVIDPRDLEADRDRYELIDTRYLVAWHISEEARKRLMSVDPRDIRVPVNSKLAL